MTHKGITLWIPEPGAYILHKILISQKRKSVTKKDKDLKSARDIGEVCLRYANCKKNMKSIYDGMPRKWQKQVLSILKDLSLEIHSFFSVKVSD
jgi:hypothetical protein